MHPHTTGTNVCGDSEIRQPQILDVDFAKCALNCGVELSAGEHGRGRICQVKELLTPLGHFLKIRFNDI